MAPEPIDEQLRRAIAEKRLIEVRYHGRRRVAEPHDYGVQNGVAKLLVYQLRAEREPSTKSTTGWRLLDVSKIEDCLVTEMTFAGSRGQQHRKHFEWEVLYARVG